MANNDRTPISEVTVGDHVLATDPETGETQARTVTDTMVMLHDGDLLDLTIEDDGGEGVIQITDNHPFWSVTDSDWEPAIELSVGEQLREEDGSTATVVKLTERPGRQDMHDLTVEVDHNLYVDFGAGAVLVHDVPDNASDGLKALFADGSVRGKTIIEIRSILLANGISQDLAFNKGGYLFTNSVGEQVRIMHRTGGWDFRAQLAGGNYLDEFGNNAKGKGAAHGIEVKCR